MVNYNEDALAVGETNRTLEVNEHFSYGASFEYGKEDVIRTKKAIEMVKQLGLPRSISEIWGLR